MTNRRDSSSRGEVDLPVNSQVDHRRDDEFLVRPMLSEEVRGACYQIVDAWSADEALKVLSLILTLRRLAACAGRIEAPHHAWTRASAKALM